LPASDQPATKGKTFIMQAKWLLAVSVAALLLLVVSASSSGAPQPSSAATKECSAITEGTSDNAAAACAQGYMDALAHATLAASCALGVSGIELFEAQHDCKYGFIFAGGVTATAPTPSANAVSECASITDGASDESPAACEQGYQGGLAGDTQDASCDHFGAGAITAVENATSCEDGWFDAKNEPGCMPGADPQNSQPGSTIKSDAETDKTCSAA
jgi:hypothetical protein